MSCALPPLCPRLKRRLSGSSIESKLPTTSTLTNKKTSSKSQVYLSKSKSISPECARMNIAPFIPDSYLHPYDSRFVTIQKGTSIERFEKLDQVQKAKKENNNLNNINVQMHVPQQQQTSSPKSESFFEPTAAISTTNKTNNENETRNKRARNSSEPNLKDKHVEHGTQLDGFPFRRYQRFVSSFRPNQAMALQKLKEQERLMVRNYSEKPTFQPWATLNKPQLMSANSVSGCKPYFWSDFSLDLELSLLSHQFDQALRISVGSTITIN